MLVYPPGYETLPVYTLTQMANGDPKIIAALSLLMIAMILLPLLFIAILKKVQHARTS
jgi:iron(III) transport system permease protein